MTLETGVRLGPYEILSPLEIAGIGEVYRGRDHGDECDVAIRVLGIDASADPALQSRLHGGVLAAGELAHPNILKIYNVGSTPDALYVVSEPFDGETLRAILDRGRLPVATAIGYAVRIAGALVAAHRQGIAHGDLRPRNVLLTSAGNVIVLGFGLTALTRTKPSSDAFAFAAMCLELLAGWWPSGVRQGWTRRRGWAAVLGLLALVAGIALPVTQYLQRARQSAAMTRVGAGEQTPAAIRSRPVAGPATDPRVERVAPLLEAAPEEGSIEESAVLDEIPVTVAEPKPEPEAAPERAPMPAPSLEPAPTPAAVLASETAPVPDAGLASGTVPAPEPRPAPEPTLEAEPPADSRDARSLITEALVRVSEFDLPGASVLLRVAAERGDRGAEIALVYVRGLVDAREAFRDGGTAASLAPVQAAIESLGTIAQGRRGAAEIARLVLQAAAAAAQSERDEMRLYLDTAIQMEVIQSAAGLTGAPLISATEVAGDLWLRVDRYDDARRSYTEAAAQAGSSLRILAGLGRAASRLKDVLAACTSYRSLLDTWGARPGLPAEITEARAYVDDTCAPAGP